MSKTVRTGAVVVSFALTSGLIAAQAQSPQRYDVLELHRLLVIPDVAKATAIERDLARAGGVFVTGRVGDTARLPDGPFSVWLSSADDAELIARFVVREAVEVGRIVTLHCDAPLRSYALVIGTCRLVRKPDQ